jgi:hypothetical protein
MGQNVITSTPSAGTFSGLVPEIKRTTKAVYVPTPHGYRLARIQKFSVPTFVPSGYELRDKKKRDRSCESPDEGGDEENLERSLRRAKVAAFDIILSNYDLDTFCTLTY